MLAIEHLIIVSSLLLVSPLALAQMPNKSAATERRITAKYPPESEPRTQPATTRTLTYYDDPK